MDYRELAPPPALASAVRFFWEMRGVAGQSLRLLPDGCADVVLHLGALPSGQVLETAAGVACRSFVVGARHSSHTVDLAGPVHAVGACLRPGGARGLLRLPAAEVADRIVGLRDLWGNAASTLESIAGDGPPEESLERFVRAVAAREIGSVSPLASAAVRAISRSGGAVRVEHLARGLGVSRRRLERHFLEQVGLSPKAFGRVLRFQQAAALVRSGRRPPWSELAVHCGYYDQAHMNREFADLAGLTPREFERQCEAEERGVAFVQDAPRQER